MIIQRFFIPGVLPGLNEIIGAAHRRNTKHGKWSGYTQMKQQMLTMIGAEIINARLKPVPSAAFTFFWGVPDKHSNPDNIRTAAKFILDALVHQKVLPNDGWQEIVSMTDTFAVNQARPGVLVKMVSPRVLV